MGGRRRDWCGGGPSLLSTVVTTHSRLIGTIYLVAVVAAFGVGGLGCYNPSVREGGFRCGPEAPFNQDCPEGFHCDKATRTCKRGPATDASVDVPIENRSDTIAEVPLEVAMDHPSEKPEVCLMPMAGCSAADAGTKCDPVCQSGCGCHEKCSVNTAGTLTCNVPSGPTVRHLGESCDPVVAQGPASQTDDCEPGMVCLDQSCGRRCNRFCWSDADCPNSACVTRGISGGFKVCDVVFSTCNPVKSAGPTGCAGMAVGCYLSSTVTDRTYCDCSFASVPVNGPCTVSRDCFGGLACVDATGSLDFHCLQVCSLMALNSGCVGGGTCRPLNSSKMYGYCN
jgi:hypothetical protein